MAVIMTTRKQPGMSLTAGEVNRLARIAQRGLSPTGDGIDLLESDTGISIRPSPAEFRLEDCRQVLHTSRLVCPLFGVLEEWQSAEAAEGPVLTKVRQPYRSGFSRLLVAREGLDENEIGWAQFQNITPVLFDRSNGRPVAGDRLGGRQDSYYARKDDLGPFRILTIFSDPDAPAPPGIAIVEITQRRGDHKNCEMMNAHRFDGAYQTLVFSDGFKVSTVSQGITKVELG